jgi:hypothetical protein
MSCCNQYVCICILFLFLFWSYLYYKANDPNKKYKLETISYIFGILLTIFGVFYINAILI